MNAMKAQAQNLSVIMLLLLALVVPHTVHAGTVVFKEDGEGLADGQAVPGWTICEGACATVTATTAVKKEGLVGIRVNGDDYRDKLLPATLFGPLEITAWMFPATDGNTNADLNFLSPTNGNALRIRINESNTWFLDGSWAHVGGAGSSVGGFGGNGWVLGPYSMDWTLVRLVLDPTLETVDVFLNNVQVGFGISTVGSDGTRYLSPGISAIGAHSGRGGAGHNSYFDDLTITATLAQVPEPSSALLLGCGIVALAGAAWRRRR